MIQRGVLTRITHSVPARKWRRTEESPRPDRLRETYERVAARTPGFASPARQTSLMPIMTDIQSISRLLQENSHELSETTVGTRRDGKAEVLSGVTEGERIIYPVPANLNDGMKVEVR